MTTLPDFLHWMQTGVDQMGSDGYRRNNWPPTDMIETPDNLYINMEIPGVDPADVNVEFYNNIVLITGNKPTSEQTSPFEINIQELIHGQFNRRITMPISVTRRDSVTISAKRGILTIDVNKNIEAQNRFVVNVAEFVESP